MRQKSQPSDFQNMLEDFQMKMEAFQNALLEPLLLPN